MTTDQWLTATLARRPPLSAAQVAALRPIFSPQTKAGPVRQAEPAPIAGSPITQEGTAL